MTPRFAEIPLARAHAHLAGYRFSEAVGAYRAALGVDPKLAAAHFGLADALNALGRGHEAVEGLVGAAEAFSTRSQHDDAIRLLHKAMVLDPSRVELHLDVAMVEEALGNHDAAGARIEGLADRYMDDGRFEEAGELLRMLASWDEDAETGRAAAVVAVQDVPYVAAPLVVAQDVILQVAAPVAAQQPVISQVAAPVAAQQPVISHVAAPAPVAVEETGPRNTVLITGETVIAFNPLLFAAARPASVPETDMESRVTLVSGGAQRLEPAPAPVARPTVRTIPARRPAPARTDVVERLRARAGLGQASGSPRRTSMRVTEPLTVRTVTPERGPHDEDVTRYFRRPRGLDAAS